MKRVVVTVATLLFAGAALAGTLATQSMTPSTTSAAVTVVSAGAFAPFLTSAPQTSAVAAAPAGNNWTNCANEGGVCTINGTMLVRYSAGDRLILKEVTGPFSCNNATFGDPVVGVAKSCFFMPVATAPQWITCASEGGTCTVPSATQVRYGASERYAFRNVTGSIACINGIFGDPISGTAKTCAYRVVSGMGLSPADTSVELPAIPSNFDINKYLVPSWGSGAIAPSSAPDVVGAFRLICAPGQLLFDDPIVYPGQPGRSHLHQFFGNTGANAYSTYASLRSSGDSTCTNMLNRSAYWIPAMLNGKGKVVRPDYVTIYYKRRPAGDPECLRLAAKGCRDLPRGLRYVFGYDMNTGQGNGFYFNCDGPTGQAGHFADIVDAAKGCPVGNRLGAIIEAPKCWDGRSLDSPDHRSHMAYPSYGGWGYEKCPDTHPYAIPAFMLGAWYTTDADLDRSGIWDANRATWRLSSDIMPGMAAKRPGSTMHADWLGGWDDTVMKMWTAGCIDKMLNCSGGDLGNGKQLRMFEGFSWNAQPRVVDTP